MVKKEKGLTNEELTKRLEQLDLAFIKIKNEKDEWIEQEYSTDLVGDPAIAILKYIADNQDNSLDDMGLTKEKITRYMDDNELSSRPTTLKLIDSLLRANLIINARKRENARNRLTINPSYSLNEYELDVLVGLIKSAHKKFKTLTDKNEDLVNGLLDIISKARSKPIEQSE